MLRAQIYRWTAACYNCDKETPVEWAFHDTQALRMSTAGEMMSKLDESPVEYIDQKGTWGNVCQECGAYQGNFYIRNAALSNSYTTTPDSEIVILPTCFSCDEEATRIAGMGEPYCDECEPGP